MIITTNNKVIQRTTPITHPAMMPTNELSSSLPLCVSAAAVIVLNTDVITLLLLVDTTEVVEVAVLVFTIVVIEVTGVVPVIDPAKVGGITEVVSQLSIIELILGECIALWNKPNELSTI